MSTNTASRSRQNQTQGSQQEPATVKQYAGHIMHINYSKKRADGTWSTPSILLMVRFINGVGFEANIDGEDVKELPCAFFVEDLDQQARIFGANQGELNLIPGDQIALNATDLVQGTTTLNDGRIVWKPLGFDPTSVGVVTRKRVRLEVSKSTEPANENVLKRMMSLFGK